MTAQGRLWATVAPYRRGLARVRATVWPSICVICCRPFIARTTGTRYCPAHQKSGTIRMFQGCATEEEREFVMLYRELRLASPRESKAAIRKRALLLWHGDACQMCWKKYPPACMDFDHIDPMTKLHNVSSMYVSHLSAFRESLKCRVLCARCHRLATTHPGGFDAAKDTVVIASADIVNVPIQPRYLEDLWPALWPTIRAAYSTHYRRVVCLATVLRDYREHASAASV